MTNIEQKEIRILYIGNGISTDYARKQSTILSGLERHNERINSNSTNNCKVSIKQIQTYDEKTDYDSYDIIISEENMTQEQLEKLHGTKLIVCPLSPIIKDLTDENGNIIRENFEYAYHISTLFIDKDKNLKEQSNCEFKVANDNQKMNPMNPVISGAIALYMQIMQRYGKNIINTKVSGYDEYARKYKKVRKKFLEKFKDPQNRFLGYDSLFFDFESYIEYLSINSLLKRNYKSVSIEYDENLNIILRNYEVKNHAKLNIKFIRPDREKNMRTIFVETIASNRNSKDIRKKVITIDLTATTIKGMHCYDVTKIGETVSELQSKENVPDFIYTAYKDIYERMREITAEIRKMTDTVGISAVEQADEFEQEVLDTNAGNVPKSAASYLHIGLKKGLFSINSNIKLISKEENN